MIDATVIWDLEDDPEGNVQHLAEHGITVEEAEEVLSDPRSRTGRSRRTGRPQVFGSTSTGKFITVIWEEVLDDPRTIYTCHSLRSPPAPREEAMSQTDSKPALSPEQQAAVEAIRARSKIERPGPGELIDSGELDELVPHGQFMELRQLTVHLRQIRERQGLSLTAVSERSGMTRAAISRLENGWNLNPTLDTLFRYATVLGAQIRLSVEECPPPRSGQA